MNHPYRMLYGPIGDTFGTWLAQYYDGLTPSVDPLYRLLRPADLRGEVNAWGGPHLTLSDANRVTDEKEFARRAALICARHEPPVVFFKELAIDRTALVIKCESDHLNTVRQEFLEATADLIDRGCLSDDEFQTALDRIRHHAGVDQADNEAALEVAHREYKSHGSPPIPTSVHFGLPFLVGLCRAGRRDSLDYFLRYGQPPWYARRSTLHLTICSGLRLAPGDQLGRTALLDKYQHELSGEIQRRLGPQPYRPPHLCMMGESKTSMVRTRRFDAVINDYVEETRPDFEVCDYASFNTAEVA